MRVTTELCPGLPGHVQLVDESRFDGDATGQEESDRQATAAMVRELDQIGVPIPERVVSVSIDRINSEKASPNLAGLQAAIHLAREIGKTNGKFETRLVVKGNGPRKFQVGEVRRGARTYEVYVRPWSDGWGTYEAETEGHELPRELGSFCPRLPDAIQIARDHITNHLPRTKAAAAIAREGR